MADEPITDTDATVTESNTAEPVGGKTKTRAPRRKSVPKEEKTESDVAPNAAKVGRGSTKTSTIAAKSEDDIGTRSSNRKRSKYTPAQRASILASIEKATRGGKTTLKAALQQANVSEQTYYNWKNAAVKQPSVPAAGSS
ncbi:MAG TPA: transcriptional regulator, partial [Ochrobactrum intermedium]